MSITTAQQLERCILLAANPSSSPINANEVSDATKFLNDFQNTGSVSLCLEVLSTTSHVEVQFYVLSTLQKCIEWGKMDVSSRLSSRNCIFQLIMRRANLTVINVSSTPSLPPYLRTKIGVVLALLVQTDYPQAWPNAFDDMLSIASYTTATTKGVNDDVFSLQSADIYLRFLDGLVDEIVEVRSTNRSKEFLQQNSIIKDIIRGYSVESVGTTVNPFAGVRNDGITVIAKIVEMIAVILGRYRKKGAVPIGHDDERQRLAASSLAVLKRFIGWIDLNLVINDATYNGFSISKTLFSCLGDETSEDDEEGLSVQAAQCILELVNKGMEPEQKLRLILTELTLFQQLKESGAIVKVDTNIYRAIKMSQIINDAGLELLGFWDMAAKASLPQVHEMKNAVASLLNQMMPLFFHFFAYDDIDVSGSMLPLASRMTASLALEKKLNISSAAQTTGFALSEYIPNLLNTMYQLMQYPLDFQYDFTDEDDAEEELFRFELRKFHKKMLHIAPDMCLSFICEAFTNMPMPISTAPTSQLEASLRLVYHHSEGTKIGTAVVMKNGSFHNVVLALHQSDITLHSHPEILMLYYDMAVRYHHILKNESNEQSELLRIVLDAMTGVRGLQHSHPRVRSRSCYLLLRLVKLLGKVMRPYVEIATSGIQGLIANPSSLPIETDDCLYLFETIGLLLGTTGLDMESQCQHLRMVITPHVHSIEAVLHSPNLHRDPDFYGSTLSTSIAAIAYLSKGFSKPPPEIQQLFLETIQISLAVLRALPAVMQVRNKTMILLQRLILCLNTLILPSLSPFLEILILHSTREDILDVSQLMNQLSQKFKAIAIPTLDVVLIPFLIKCNDLMPNANEVINNNTSPAVGSNEVIVLPPHLITEQIAVKKLTFSVLQSLVANGVTNILLTPSNAPHIEKVLHTMSEGAIDASHCYDPIVRKTCISFFRHLIDQWCSPSTLHDASQQMQQHTIIHNGFLRFLLDSVLPGLLRSLLHPSFNHHDALQSRCLSEIAKILTTLKDRIGTTEFDTSVALKFFTGDLASTSLLQDVSKAFSQAVTSKDMEKCLTIMITSSKQ